VNKGGKVEMRGSKLRSHVYGALPGTVREIAERIGAPTDTVEIVMRDFKALGLCHRSKIVLSPGKRNVPTGYYSRGRGVNVPFPRPLRHTQPGASSIAFASLVRAAKTGATVRELCDATGLYPHLVRSCLKVLKGYGQAHVSGWSVSAYQPVQEWRIAEGANAPRPKPLTRTEVNARYWARTKSARAANALMQAWAA